MNQNELSRQLPLTGKRVAIEERTQRGTVLDRFRGALRSQRKRPGEIWVMRDRRLYVVHRDKETLNHYIVLGEGRQLW